jgi:peroxiredoxin
MRKRAPGWNLRSLLLVAACFALATGLLLHHRPRTMTVGDPLPPVPLNQLDGTAVDVSELPRTAVYNVFTSWCPACNDELPDIRAAASMLAKRGVAFVGIDQGESPWQIERFAQSNGLRYPILVDGARLTTSRFGARIIPETIVVRDGIVRHVIVGPASTAEIVAAAAR